MKSDIYELGKTQNAEKGTRGFVRISEDHSIARNAKMGDDIIIIKRGREIRTWAIIDKDAIPSIGTHADFVDENFARYAKMTFGGETLLHLERTWDGDIIRRRAVFTAY